MNVHHCARGHAACSEEIVQHRYMAVSRKWDPHRIDLDPVQYLLPCFSDRHGVGKGRAVGRESNESQKAVPGQSDPRAAVKLFTEPSMRAYVLVHGSDMRIQQKIRIDEDHLRPILRRSSSSWMSAISSFNSSGLLKSGLPRSKVFIRKGLCCSFGLRRIST